MKKAYLLLVIFSFFLLSCGSSKDKVKISSKTFQDEYCPDFKVEVNKSGSTKKIFTEKIDILPVFFDTSLNSSENDNVTNEKEILRRQLESIVYNSLKKFNIEFYPYKFNDFSKKDISDYKLSIRKSSFAFAHDKFVPKEYYTNAIENIGNEKYKLGFFFQIFPRDNEHERIYIHALLYDTEKKKNVYYKYLIYENCSVRYLDNFSKVIDAVVVTFKNRNMSREN